MSSHVDVIAVDGPAASGKSTVARRVAAALERLYVDSGALYRGVTHAVLARGIDPADGCAVAGAMPGLRVTFFVEEGRVTFRVDGEDVAAAIRRPEINSSVSLVAAVPEVRRQVTQWLRDMRSHGSLVMEGRDIGTVVFPDARWKFYLDASELERARRRHAEMNTGGAVEDVDRSLRRRDALDSTRKVAPLKTAGDAVVIDTTGLSIDGVVERILQVLSSGSREPR
jgi:cytidylate kinase